MLFKIEELRKMTLEEINEKYLGQIPHSLKDDDSFFKMLSIIYDKLKIKPTQEQHNIVLAACSRKHPVLVDSCAGSGKTTLAQIITLIDEFAFKVAPIRILNITYSSQAAGDMKLRHSSFCSKFGVQSKIDMRTMHSFYSAFLETYCNRLGMPSYSPRQNLMNEQEIYQMLRTIYLSTYSTKYVSNDTLKEFYSVMCYIKDSFTSEFDIPYLKKFKELDTDLAKFKAVMKSFDTQKRVSMPQKIDYTDMQVLFLKLITENADILARVKNSYDRIIVDEFQDTSVLQIKILELITKDPNKLLAIGDKDQQIYSWRGANPLSYNDFMSIFKGTELHTMGMNMRCPNNIIGKAEKLVSNNPNRNEKNMVGTDKEGAIDIIPCKNSFKAISEIATRIMNDYKTNGAEALKKQIVLYRTHTQPMFLIDILLKKDIPVNAIGTKLPYDDKITRDFIDIYYMIENPRDGELASEHLFKICKSFNKRQMPSIKKNLNGFNKITDLGTLANYNHWRDDLQLLTKIIGMVDDNKTVAELADVILPAYYNNYYKFIAEKQGILEDHISTVFNYLRMQQVTFHKFMTDMIKIQKKLEYNNSMRAGITLGTVHSAKGLEYDTVYILDPNNKVSPNEKAVDDLAAEDSIESLEYLIEELNIFYVAITRAKKHLVIAYNEQIPSRFLYYADFLDDKRKALFEERFPTKYAPLDLLQRPRDLMLEGDNNAIVASDNLNENNPYLGADVAITEEEIAHIEYISMHDESNIIDRISSIPLLADDFDYIQSSKDTDKNSTEALLDLNWDLNLDNIESIPNM